MPQHFYMRVVPKYGVTDKGSTGIKDCHNFFIGCNLGQAGKLVSQEKGETPSSKERDLCFTFFPKYKMEK